MVSPLDMYANPVTMEAFRELCVMEGPVNDSLPSAILWATIFGETLKGSSTGPTITLRTPWRPPCWQGSRTLRPSGNEKYCCDHVEYLLPPAIPWTVFLNASKKIINGTHHNTSDSLMSSMVAPCTDMITAQGPGGEYARLVPLPL